jgi:cysteine synthase A
MAMTNDRKKKYDELEARVGKTPLIEVTANSRFQVPRGNRIFAKKEYCNPTGSHYDRYWVRLLRVREEQGIIDPNQSFPLLETTTGNSGAAFAWACRELGYPCEVFIPQDMPGARIKQLEHYNATVSYSPEGEYVAGLIRSFRERLKTQRRKYIITDHANDQCDGVSAIYELGKEIVSDIERFGVSEVDCFVSALGNGLTTRFIGQAFYERYGEKTSLYGMEPYESPTVYQSVFPEKYRTKFHNINLSGGHDLIGTGPGETGFAFPNMQKVIASGRIKDIFLEKHDQWIQRYHQLARYLNEHVGHTSAACLDAAIRLVNTNPRMKNKNIVIIFYDADWKYSDKYPQEYRN